MTWNRTHCPYCYRWVRIGHADRCNRWRSQRDRRKALVLVGMTVLVGVGLLSLGSIS